MRVVADRCLRFWLLAALVATAFLSLASSQLSCSCEVRTLRRTVVHVTCSETQNGTTDVSCIRDDQAAAKVPQYVRNDFLFLEPQSLLKFSRVTSDWEGARAVCRALGGDLFVPRDPMIYETLTNFGSLFTESFIGLTDIQSEGFFVDVEGNRAMFLNWRWGEPNNNNGRENCVALDNRGKTLDSDCDEYRQFVCERRLRTMPPADYAYAPEAGAFLRLSEDQRPHPGAAAACRAQGGALFVPDTLERVQVLLRLVPVDIGDILVGFTDAHTEGSFVTETGRQLSDMDFQNWLPGEPNDGGATRTRGEDCVVLHSHGFLVDVDCDAPRRYVCEWLP